MSTKPPFLFRFYLREITTFLFLPSLFLSSSRFARQTFLCLPLTGEANFSWQPENCVQSGMCACGFLLCAVNRNESRGLFLGWFLAVVFLISLSLNPLQHEGSLLPLPPLCHRNGGSVTWQSKLWWSGVVLSGFGYKKICKMSFSSVKNQCHCRIRICWISVSTSNFFPMTLHHCCVAFLFFFSEDNKWKLKNKTRKLKMKGHTYINKLFGMMLDIL